MSLSIAIITPSLNQGDFIGRTIDSVLNQNRPLFYDVRDGGSTDNTLSILQKYTKELSLHVQKDTGQAQAINRGIQGTNSDIIGWLNSDDTYLPNVLSMILQYFNDHPDVDVIYGRGVFIDADDQILRPYLTRPHKESFLYQSCYICQPAFFFRRRLVDQHGLLNEQLHYCMDYEYWLRLSMAGAKFHYLPKVLATYRLHDATKTMAQGQALRNEAMQMLKQKLGYVPGGWFLAYAVGQLQAEQRNLKQHPVEYFKTLKQTLLQISQQWQQPIDQKCLIEMTTRLYIHITGSMRAKWEV